MRTIRPYTFVKVLKNGRFRHAKVLTVTDQDNLELNIGNETTFDADRATSGVGVTTTRGFDFATEKSTKTNYVLNPSFETNVTGWTNLNVNYAVSQYTTDAKFGSNSMRVDCLAATGNYGGAWLNRTLSPAQRIQVAQGETWTVQAHFKKLVGNRTNRLELRTYATYNATTVQETFTGSSVTADDWTKAAITATFTNANSLYMDIRLVHSTTGAANDAFLVDGVIAVEDSINDYYWDGTDSNLTDGFDATLAWTGTANASTSTANAIF
jgi:hypothetical protein